jgi:hypothetical protein
LPSVVNITVSPNEKKCKSVEVNTLFKHEKEINQIRFNVDKKENNIASTPKQEKEIKKSSSP